MKATRSSTSPGCMPAFAAGLPGSTPATSLPTEYATPIDSTGTRAARQRQHVVLVTRLGVHSTVRPVVTLLVRAARDFQSDGLPDPLFEPLREDHRVANGLSVDALDHVTDLEPALAAGLPSRTASTGPMLHGQPDGAQRLGWERDLQCFRCTRRVSSVGVPCGARSTTTVTGLARLAANAVSSSSAGNSPCSLARDRSSGSAVDRDDAIAGGEFGCGLAGRHVGHGSAIGRPRLWSAWRRTPSVANSLNAPLHQPIAGYDRNPLPLAVRQFQLAGPSAGVLRPSRAARSAASIPVEPQVVAFRGRTARSARSCVPTGTSSTQAGEPPTVPPISHGS